MTIADIARIEGVTERSAQRYVTVGFKGNKLPATKRGRTYSIAVEDYRAWRLECGFDFLPQQDVIPEVPRVRQDKVPATVAPKPYPPYPQPANPGGPITNVPHPTSGNMPHPLACLDYIEKQKLKARGENL